MFCNIVLLFFLKLALSLSLAQKLTLSQVQDSHFYFVCSRRDGRRNTLPGLFQVPVLSLCADAGVQGLLSTVCAIRF